jgi:hypothetical protein
MLPEARCHEGLEMGFVPYIGMQVAPFLTEGVEVGLINRESLGICLWNELRLTGYGPHVFRILGFAKTHIVITTDRVAERLVINVGGDVEVHATAHIFHYKTIASWGSRLEVDIPYISADEILLASLFLGVGSLLPELHGTNILLLLSLYIVKVHLTALQCLIVALATIAQPLVEISSMGLFCRRIANNVHMNSL